MNILLVDDHVLFREGLASYLAAQPDFLVVGTAVSIKETIVKVHELQPDLVLMSFDLPDGTGLDATTSLLSEWPQLPILFLAADEEDGQMVQAVHRGAYGYLMKDAPAVELLALLRGVIRGVNFSRRTTHPI